MINNHIIPNLGSKIITQVATQDIQKMYNKFKRSGRMEKHKVHGHELSNSMVRAIHIRFHDLRHTFATHAASNGVDPKTLAGILGHTKASFTLDTYTHVTTDMQRNASGIVGNYITDIFGKELKPWQDDENQDQEQ